MNHNHTIINNQSLNRKKMSQIRKAVEAILEHTRSIGVQLQKRRTRNLILFLFLSSFGIDLKAQVQASGYAFNYFEREWFSSNENGAGYSFYTSVYPIMQQYPGPSNFQLGLTSTWMTPLTTNNEPEGFYNTIEGGLGWWHDTRFGTATPKFIMGGVANGFSQWANGPGAGSSDLLANGQRDWSVPGGKYGIAQLSNQLLWAPDGLNMAQGANGEYLGYGYHPLPLTDVMQTTNGVDFVTGNQCWTLFLNTSNFKGAVAFFIPKFWTETALNNPNLEGLFLDQRPTDKNQAFAIEYAEAPALIGYDTNGDAYAHLLPLSFPATTNNSTELVKEIKVYTKNAKWDAVENWFNGGAVAPTQFQANGIENVFFNVSSGVDGHIKTNLGNPLEAAIDMSGFATKTNSADQTIAGFSFDTNQVTSQDGMFVMPEFYKLNPNGEWLPITENEIPTATGLVVNTPDITQRPEITYVTPKEADCHIQDPQSPWNSPGPSAGPFTVSLGDGSKLTYYWYKFIDQPAIIHANLPTNMRENLQTRVEQIHTHWSHTDNYLPNISSGELVDLDGGQIVAPPAGMEIGYVPIVTRQELDETVNVVDSHEKNRVVIYPNPSNGIITIQAEKILYKDIRIYDVLGRLMFSDRINSTSKVLNLNFPNGIYTLMLSDEEGVFARKIFLSK